MKEGKTMFGFRRTLILVLCFCCCFLPSAQACDNVACFISGIDPAALVNMHASPDANSPVVFSFYAGVGVESLSHQDGWVAVHLPGIPGLPLQEEKYVQEYGDPLQPNGYLAEEYVYEVQWLELNWFHDQLPKATPIASNGEMVLLRSAPNENAPLQAALLPDTDIHLMGKTNGFYLVCADTGVFGYLPEASVITDGKSSALPKDLLWERPDYYDDFPLTFALVNTAEDDGLLPLLAAPDAQANATAMYACGTVVQILEDQRPYCRVRTVDGEGYMERALLQVDGEPGKQVLTGIWDLRFIVTGVDFDLRSFPDDHALLIRTPYTVDMEVLALTGSWYYVRFTNWGDEQCYQGYMRPDEWSTPYIGVRQGLTEYGVLILPEDMIRLPLYASPSLDSPVLARYFHTTQVEVLEADGVPLDSAFPLWDFDRDWEDTGFYRVRVDGKEGYMPARYVKLMQRGDPSQG